MNKIQLIDEKINSIQNMNQHLNIKYSNINKAVGLLKSAKLYKINTRSQMLIDLINLALKDIFFDKDVKIDIKSNESNSGITGYNVTYDIVFYSNGNELGKNQDVYDSTGGGLITIISFILKILMGYINDTGKFFIFDEAFSQLSVKYLDNLSYFIRELCEKYNFTILFIAHEDISKHAHISYRFKGSVKDKIDTLLLDSYDLNIAINDAVISEPKDLVDYYLLKAEKFQSIEKIELPIKGFTCIRGDSGIGKTSIARAINSIINNDFKDKYKRINTRGSTVIQFGFVNANKEYNKITLEYKGSTVHYILDSGEELKGKALAKERISEALELMGFKKIDLSVYKSWNSELANQTARVNVTTQHDKLYFSNERNSTEKLLTLLFNSENFNEGIREGSETSQNIRQAIIKNEEALVELHYQRLLAQRDELVNVIENLDLLKSCKSLLTNVQLKQMKILERKNKIDEAFNHIRNYSRIINQTNLATENHISIAKMKVNYTLISQNLTVVQNILNKIQDVSKQYFSSINAKNQSESLSVLKDKFTQLNVKIKKYKDVDKLESIHKINVLSEKIYDLSKVIKSKTSRNIQLKSDLETTNFKFNEIKSSISKINLINSTMNFNNSVTIASNKLKTIMEKLSHYRSFDNILEKVEGYNNLKFKIEKALEIQSSLASLEVKKDNLITSIRELETEHNKFMCMVEDCPHCMGLGYIIKG